MRTIQTTRGIEAIVDDEDYAALSLFKWYAHKGKTTWYARTDLVIGGVKLRIYMHRLMMIGADMIDHADGNGMNNRKSNLRVATESQNQANRKKGTGNLSSIYKGVTWDKSRKSWIAQIAYKGNHKSLGRHGCEHKAAAVYDVHAKALFGEFSTSNLGVLWSAA